MQGLTESRRAVRAILFDLDGTLFDRDGSLRPPLEDQFNSFSSELRHVARDVFVYRVITLDAHGYVAEPEVYSQIVSEFGLQDTLAATLVEHFTERYAFFALPFDGVVSTLRHLKNAGLELGIVTNGSERIQQSVIDALHFGDSLTAVAISETAGIRKPDPRIFQQTAAETGVQVSECCFVGDHHDGSGIN